MALAIARAIDNSGLVPRGERTRLFYDPASAHTDAFHALGFASVSSPDALLKQAGMIVLAVKPQQWPDIQPRVSGKCGGKCVVSILAGITANKLRHGIGSAGAAVYRVMPNTPMMCGWGSAVVAEPLPEDVDWLPDVLSLFASSGTVEVLPEDLMDAATGLNGSSPAFFFRMVEAMARWGEGQGIPYAKALRLSAQAMAGAAVMALGEDGSPQELLNRVTSKGGTTLAALSAFDEYGLEPMLNEALRRCRVRARELGEG
jgi:pyrroline-5-carboxylate reductase